MLPGRLLLFLLVTVGVLAAAFFGLTRRFTVPSAAMEPTVASGDHVAVFRFSDSFTSPHRKDIVVFTRTSALPGCGGGTKAVARIVGLPGETVSERDGVLSVDGTPLKEPYVRADRRDHATRAWHVPQDGYLVAGDNRRSPCAVPTAVPKKDVVGKVFLTFWPVDRISVG